MESRIKKRMLISTLMCLIPIIFGLAIYNKLPDEVAVHFDSYGEPNGYMSRVGSVFILPVFLAVINIVVNLGVENDPRNRNQTPFIKNFSVWLVPVISLIVQSYILLYALDDSINSGNSVVIGMGIMLILIGNYLPKCRQNNSIGIKVPWTLSDVDNWNKTHRLAGILWVLGGIIIVVLGLLHANGMYTLIVTLAAAFIPIVYSFLLACKNKS